ncbi:hypothetical protein JL722_4908 [Aureococcus anophagefferens]|nr:hypothetical protein JL722_4908 [Aureococcus anophagefferens]
MASCPVHSRQWEPFVPKLSRVPLDGALLRRRTPATGGDGEVRKMALKYVRTWPDALTRKEVVSLVNDHVSGLPGLVFLERAAEFATAAARAAPRAFYGGDGRPGISAGGISPFLSDAVEQLLNEGDVVADAAALAAAEASPRSAPPSARSPRSRATALSSDASRGALVAILRFLACCDSSSEYKRTSAWKRCRHLGSHEAAFASKIGATKRLEALETLLERTLLRAAELKAQRATTADAAWRERLAVLWSQRCRLVKAHDGCKASFRDLGDLIFAKARGDERPPPLVYTDAHERLVDRNRRLRECAAGLQELDRAARALMADTGSAGPEIRSDRLSLDDALKRAFDGTGPPRRPGDETAAGLVRRIREKLARRGGGATARGRRPRASGPRRRRGRRPGGKTS